MDRLPKHALKTSDILELVHSLKIPNFAGVRMRDELVGKQAGTHECGIVNLDLSTGLGTHWICYYCNGRGQRYFFDSFAEPPPLELLHYLKTPSEWNVPVIKRNSLTVQHAQSSECGSLCLFVLKQLSLGIEFPKIIDLLYKRFLRN